jgi:hypothetical protein
MTRQIINTLSVAAAVFCASCGTGRPTATAEAVNATAPAASIAKMEWLTGLWEMQTPEGTAFEEWHMAGGAEMRGRAGFIKGSDTMASETVVLAARDTGLFYIPTVKDQNNGEPVPFRLATAAGDSFVFENPAHDFPQAICYKKMGDTAMEARIWGKVNGEVVSEGFVLRKAK